MKKYTFINYYSDKNEERKKEYLYCVEKNIEPNFIDKVFIFVETPEAKKDIPHNDKIVFVDIPKRMEFKDVIEYAAKNLEDDSIVIILNLDIFIENSKEWANIDKEFFEVGHDKKALVCKRHNLNEDMSTWIEDYSWGKGEFCDAWVMKTPFDLNFLKEDFNFCVGNAPQCDNTMMYLMSKYNHVFSWGSKYKVFHYDVCRGKKNANNMIFSEKTDFRPSQRRNEHIDIPANQDWEYLLKSKIQPKYLPTWRMYLLTINI
jgi:hypothetical protein